MKLMYTSLYHLILFVGKLLIRFSSFFNLKQKKWIEGQKGLLNKIESDFSNSSSRKIWIHAASLGEYEQAKPILFQLKKLYPHEIIVTLFSPSGYEVAIKERLINYIYYLPLDFKHNSERFLNIVKPELVLFIKYEFWRNYCFSIRKRKTPLISVSTRIHPEQFFFKWYGRHYLKVLKCFTHFFTQDKQSLELLDTIGFKNTTFSGDTRFDRVSDILKKKKQIPVIEQFKEDSKLIIIGSSWPEDINMMLSYLHNIPEGWKVVIAPHKVDEKSINSLKKQLSSIPKETYSTFNNSKSKILILNTIGLLSSAYQYASIAYVGGAFKTGLHNIMEPAVYGTPVLFGPKHQKFSEAAAFIEEKIGFSIKYSHEFSRVMTYFTDNEDIIPEIGKIAHRFIKEQQGASQKILNFCYPILHQSND